MRTLYLPLLASAAVLAACQQTATDNSAPDTKTTAAPADITEVPDESVPAATDEAASDTPEQTPPPTAEPAAIVVPQALRGEWREQLADCGKQVPSRLRITDKMNMTAFDNAKIIKVTDLGGSAYELTLQGENRFQTGLKLSNANQTLADMGGGGMVWQRCPA